MRRNAGVTGVQAVLIGSGIACLVFGQSTGTRQEIEALRQQAETAAGGGEWSEAASLYQSAIPLEQGSAWAHMGLADIYRANGVWEKAGEQYDAAVAIDPADVRTKQLAVLSRQALAEERAGFVKAQTFRAMAEFPWSWLRNSSGQSRDLTFQSKTQEPTPQRIPIQGAFPRDKFTLDSLPPASLRQLEEVAAMIGTGVDRPLKIVVEGNTCRCGSDAANVELGSKRAEAVREFLISRRVAPKDKIITISFGSSRPVESAGAPSLPAAVCERDAIHSQNRRVVIVVYSEGKVLTKGTPTLDVSFLSRRAGTNGYELVSDGGQLRGGDEYKIRFRAEATVYAYAFHRGSSGKWDVLFPERPGRPQSERLSNPLGAGRDLSIPTADAGFVLTGDPGMEETYVYSRQERDQALEALIQNIETGGAVELRPPALVATEVTARKPQVGPPAGPNPTGSNGVVPKTPKPQAPPTPPQPVRQAQEGEDQIRMKDLTRPEDLDSRTPQLPPDPAAYVRFQHVK